MTTRIKLRRDTATNWTDINPVLALAEPGVETDTNKMKVGDGVKTWTELQYIDGADVTRIKAGWIQSIGNIPEIGNGEGEDFWFDSVAVDNDNNSYYVGSNYNDDTPWTVKLDSNGDIVWQTRLTDFDGFEGAGQAVQVDPTNGDVVVIADMWGDIGAGGEAGMMLYRLSSTDGSLVGNPVRIRDDVSANSVDIYPYDLIMDGNDAIIIGGRNDDKTSTEVPKQTGSAGQSIIILSSAVESGVYPRAYNNWYVSGTDINGEGVVTAVNAYNDVSGTVSGDSSGNGAAFNFSFYVYKGVTYKTVQLTGSTGSGYAVNDTITFTAIDVGGSVDAVLTVTAIGGSGQISTFTTTTYTPDLTKIKLTVEPNGGSVNFSNSGTWNLVQYKGDSGFVKSEQNGGWTSIVGDSDNDWFNVGAIDSNSNVYAAGRTYDDNYFGGWNRSLLVKYNSSGVVQYKKIFDFNGSEGSNGYTGICVDSNDNVYLAGQVYDFDDTGDWMNVITKVDSTGTLVWQKRFSQGQDPFNMWNMCLSIDSDDNIYLGAEFDSPTSLSDDFFFAKFDSNGNNIWQRMLRSYGDVNSQWNNGYQIIKVKGDKFYFGASTEVYNNNNNNSALALCLPTDGSGLGNIANSTWEYVSYDLNWSDTINQQTSIAQVSSVEAVFTTDEPTTGSTSTEYTNAFLNVYKGQGGEVGVVKQITFEDGTVQTSAAKTYIPQIIEGTMHGNYDLYLRLDHAGKFIRVNDYNGSTRIYVPTNENVPFEVGTVITIITDPLYNNSNWVQVWPDNGPDNPEILGSGYSANNPADGWYLSNAQNGEAGVYRLMKIDTDRWIVDGPSLGEAWC